MTKRDKKMKSKRVVDLFIDAVKSKNISMIEVLLDQKGEYEIEPEKEDTLDVSKDQFIHWFTEKLHQTEINTVAYDQCLDCLIGAPVILFNNGTFPRTTKLGDKPKSGLLLNINENGLIDHIKFCFTFLHAENKYVPKKSTTDLDILINEGHSVEQALKILNSRSKERGRDGDLPF